MVEERLANIQEAEAQESDSPPPPQAIGSKRHSIVSLSSFWSSKETSSDVSMIYVISQSSDFDL